MADNHLAMSDEEFLKQPQPEMAGVAPVSADEAGTAEETSVPETPAIIQEETPQPEVENEANEEEVPSTGSPSEEAPKEEEKPKPEEKTGEDNKSAEPKVEPKAEPKVEAEAIDYKAFHDNIMKPFTANGKEIVLKSPEEAIQLMQMGANYTRKLQELAPHRKLVQMLSNNDLLDESKLSFLIDLDKKNPEAIKKFIKESGIDPLDIDINSEPAYREGSHKVSDQEVAFNTQVDELASNPKGLETITIIDKKWDQASKDLLWQHPEVMSIIHTQRENGVYDTITTEMDRLITLGQLSPTTPFLEAYKTVGDKLYPAPTNSGDPAPAPKAEPAPVVTRVAAPKPTLDNGDKVGAASPTRSAPGKAKGAVNFLSMSDDEFAKLDGFAGRV